MYDLTKLFGNSQVSILRTFNLRSIIIINYLRVVFVWGLFSPCLFISSLFFRNNITISNFACFLLFLHECIINWDAQRYKWLSIIILARIFSFSYISNLIDALWFWYVFKLYFKYKLLISRHLFSKSVVQIRLKWLFADIVLDQWDYICLLIWFVWVSGGAWWNTNSNSCLNLVVFRIFSRIDIW